MKANSWWWLVSLFLFTFWMGARGLNLDNIWGDEYTSIKLIVDAHEEFRSNTLPEVWERRAEVAMTPPGYYLALSVWERMVGVEVAPLRALSLFIGMIALAWTYRLGVDMGVARASLYATWVLGTSGFYIYYLHEMRTYTLIVWATVFTLWVYLRILDRKAPPRWWHWTGLAIGSLTLLYTHYFAAALLVALGVYHVLFAPKNRRWWGVVGVMIVVGLAFLPWFRYFLFGADAKSESGNQGDLHIFTPPQLVWETLFIFSNGFIPLSIVGLLALRLDQRYQRRLWFFTLLITLVLIALNAALRVIDVEHMRYTIAVWPLLALLIGIGFARLTQWRWGRALIVPLLALWLVSGVGQSFARGLVDDNIRSYQGQHAYEAIGDLVAPGDHVIGYVPDGMRISTSRGLIAYYFRDEGVDVSTVGTLPEGWDQEDEYFSPFEYTSPEQPRLWVLQMTDRPSTTLPGFESVLAELGYATCQAPVEYGVIAADLYARSPACCLPPGQPLARYGDLFALDHIDASFHDETLVIGSAWRIVGEVPPDAYSVSFQIFDGAGEKVAQYDEGLVSLARACKTVEIPLENATAGEYQVQATVYDWRSGEGLPGVLPSTDQTANLLPVATFAVQPQTTAALTTQSR